MFKVKKENKNNLTEEKLKEFKSITYSESIGDLCVFYKKINMISWCVILFGIVEPRILIPAFIGMIAIFLNKRVRLSWRVFDFIEKLKIKQYDKAKDHLNKIEFLDDEEVFNELKLLYEEKVVA